MPLESRIRNGLARNADAVNPDVERCLGSVRSRARRRVIARRVAAGLAVSATAAAVIAVGPQAIRAIRDVGRPAPAAKRSPHPGLGALSGSFTRQIAPRGAAVRVNRMAGRWIIELRNGTIDLVTVPPAFGGLLSTFQYAVRGSEFRTNLFIQDVCINKAAGVYRWARSGRTLRFVTVDDPCPARVAFFTSGPWRENS